MPSRSATRPASARIARKSDGEPEVALSRRGLERLRCGHVWVYRTDLRARAGLKGGEVVGLVDARGWVVGTAFYGKQRQISVRLLTREDEPIDEAFFARRLAQARALREAAAPDPELRRAGRVVHGEADLLPGLVVDRYGDCLVMQTLIEATDARRELFADLLQELWKPRAIVERNDVKVRAHEGLPARKGLLRGADPGPVEFLEGEVKLAADLLEGQKTGAFLDQAENRIEAGRYARGRALDCFTYGGAFALHLARRAGGRELFVPRRRARLRAHGARRRRRRGALGAGDRAARSGTRSSDAARRSRDAVSQGPHPAGAVAASIRATTPTNRSTSCGSKRKSCSLVMIRVASRKPCAARNGRVVVSASNDSQMARIRPGRPISGSGPSRGTRSRWHSYAPCARSSAARDTSPSRRMARAESSGLAFTARRPFSSSLPDFCKTVLGIAAIPTSWNIAAIPRSWRRFLESPSREPKVMASTATLAACTPQ